LRQKYGKKLILNGIIPFTMVVAIIPARYASTRFPGKPLVQIQGKSMIQRVWEQVSLAPSVDQVVVATDDQRIYDHVAAFGGAVQMTRSDHPSGTDRCAEVAARFPQASLVINVQGDEPFIQPEQIELIISTLQNSTTSAGIATLVKKIEDSAVLDNPNIVKAVVSQQGEALYFSRHPIPYQRGRAQSEWLQFQTYYKHIGLYGFRRKTLAELALLSPTPLEQAESLEQLRWLEHGYRIACAVTVLETVGIDTEEDWVRVNG
jgi:3-deoxy-manno-octulosonate cytidylyltransferase (CMP-KDO synthetase)